MKYKSKAAGVIRFDYKGAEKIIEPGHTYELEENEYLEGLVAFGLLEIKESPVEKPDTTVKSK